MLSCKKNNPKSPNNLFNLFKAYWKTILKKTKNKTCLKTKWFWHNTYLLYTVVPHIMYTMYVAQPDNVPSLHQFYKLYMFKTKVFSLYEIIVFIFQPFLVFLILWMPSRVSSYEYLGFLPFQTTSHTLCIWYLVSRHCSHLWHPAGSLFGFHHLPCPVRCTYPGHVAPSAGGRWRGVWPVTDGRCSTGHIAGTGWMSHPTCVEECAHGKLQYSQWWIHRRHTYEL